MLKESCSLPATGRTWTYRFLVDLRRGPRRGSPPVLHVASRSLQHLGWQVRPDAVALLVDYAELAHGLEIGPEPPKTLVRLALVEGPKFRGRQNDVALTEFLAETGDLLFHFSFDLPQSRVDKPLELGEHGRWCLGDLRATSLFGGRRFVNSSGKGVVFHGYTLLCTV